MHVTAMPRAVNTQVVLCKELRHLRIVSKVQLELPPIAPAPISILTRSNHDLKPQFQAFAQKKVISRVCVRKYARQDLNAPPPSLLSTQCGFTT